MYINGLNVFGRLTAALVIYFILSVVPAQAQDVAGETVSVQPNATLKDPRGRVTLQVGMDVKMGDLVRTNRRGEAQLIFTDDTKLVVGPNSSLVIESYLLRSDNRVNSFTVKALGGTFRMITGKSDKSAYKFTTPSATIGVRGTIFDFAIWSFGRTDLFVYDGTAILCDAFDTCLTVTETCNVARAQRFRRPRFLEDENEIVDSLAERLPYFLFDDHLDPRFQATPRGCSPERISRVRLAASERQQRSPIHDREIHNNDQDREPISRPEREPPQRDTYPDPPPCNIC